MLLGVRIEPVMLVAGGALMFALMVFQVLQGLRKIAFKGKLHTQVHKAVAFAILAAMAFHALAALALLDYI